MLLLFAFQPCCCVDHERSLWAAQQWKLLAKWSTLGELGLMTGVLQPGQAALLIWRCLWKLQVSVRVWGSVTLYVLNVTEWIPSRQGVVCSSFTVGKWDKCLQLSSSFRAWKIDFVSVCKAGAFSTTSLKSCSKTFNFHLSKSLTPAERNLLL